MKVEILGLGSVLMTDDAVGPTVVRTLEARWEFPPGVRLLDLGTPGPDLHSLIEPDTEALIFIDAVRADGAPGELKTYRRERILERPPPQRMGPHDPNLREALLSMEFSGRKFQEVLLVGVIPERVEQGFELSPRVAAAVPRAEGAVLSELERLGLPARRREPPGTPDLWWQRR